MFCAYTRPRNQVSVYRTIGPLVYITSVQLKSLMLRAKFQDHCTAGALIYRNRPNYQNGPLSKPLSTFYVFY